MRQLFWNGLLILLVVGLVLKFATGILLGILPLLILVLLFFFGIFCLRKMGKIKTGESVTDAIRRLFQYVRKP